MNPEYITGSRYLVGVQEEKYGGARRRSLIKYTLSVLGLFIGL